jgi:hypothetical protein
MVVMMLSIDVVEYADPQIKGRTYFWADSERYKNAFAEIRSRYEGLFTTQASGHSDTNTRLQTCLICEKNGIKAAWILWNEIRTQDIQ